MELNFHVKPQQQNLLPCEKGYLGLSTNSAPIPFHLCCISAGYGYTSEFNTCTICQISRFIHITKLMKTKIFEKKIRLETVAATLAIKVVHLDNCYENEKRTYFSSEKYPKQHWRMQNRWQNALNVMDYRKEKLIWELETSLFFSSKIP